MVVLEESKIMFLLSFQHQEDIHAKVIEYHEKSISQIIILKIECNLRMFLVFALKDSNLL